MQPDTAQDHDSNGILQLQKLLQLEQGQLEVPET
jgi:hypothetical protein